MINSRVGWRPAERDEVRCATRATPPPARKRRRVYSGIEDETRRVFAELYELLHITEEQGEVLPCCDEWDLQLHQVCAAEGVYANDLLSVEDAVDSGCGKYEIDWIVDCTEYECTQRSERPITPVRDEVAIVAWIPTTPPKPKPKTLDPLARADRAMVSCTCKRTKCLKLYCACFSAKSYCTATCKCADACGNKTISDRQRRQQAIVDVVWGSSRGRFREDKVRGEVHEIGCRCRRSRCMKKYCECFASAIACTSKCRCSDCSNPNQLSTQKAQSDAVAML